MATKRTAAKVEALRGKERLQQLTEAFPGATPRQVISVDLAREGLKPNETTSQVGRWALPDAPAYFERQKESVSKTAEKAEAYYLTPVMSYFGDGVGWAPMFDSGSPYEVRYEEKGRYRLYRDGDAIEEVFFTPRPQWYDRKTTSGKPMASVISQFREDALKIGALTYCEYGKDDLTCRYCNINSSEAVNRTTGIVRQTAKRDQDVYETMLAACQEKQQHWIVVSGGVILDSSKEADNYARIVKVMRRAEKDAGYETPTLMTLKSQAMEMADIMKLKEAGAPQLQLGFNLEVWDPKLFEWLCPGKAKYVGRERWIERLLAAVEVFGRGGMVSSTLMQGLEMMPPHGFKTEDEGAASYLEGIEWLLAHGVSAGGYPLRCQPDTEFVGNPLPRTEYLLRLQQGCSALYKKYNLSRVVRA